MFVPPPSFLRVLSVGVTSLTYVTFAISSTATITVPASAADGDLGILFSWARSSGIPTDSTPSGWTQCTNGTAGNANGSFDNIRISAFYKKLVSGDVSASVSGLSGVYTTSNVMFILRPDAPISSVTSSTFNAQATAGNPTSQTVTASGQPAPLVVLGGVGSSSTNAAFSTASPAFDGTQLNASSNLIGGYKIYNTSPADHSIDANDLGNGIGLLSGYLRVA